MAEFPDVLDAMGKTPREFGVLHVHLESLQQVDTGRYVATVLFQGAFEPMAPAVVEFIDMAAQATLLRVDVPVLEDGRVLRLRAPLRAKSLQQLGLATECPEPGRGARRVRPAWKLFDTIEGPSESDLNQATARLERRGRNGLRVVDAENDLKRVVHAARELPSVMTVDLSPGTATPLSEPEFEVLWVVGQQVPMAAAPSLQPKFETKARRWCRVCNFEGSAEDYGDARFCPNCDTEW